MASPKDELKARFVGQSLHDVPVPSVILDLAKVKVNCQRMLDATQSLGLLFRAHIKTHKTTELTRLQLGPSPTTPALLMGSTLLELESILPLLQSHLTSHRPTNILLAFPVFPSALPRLTALSAALGPTDSLSLLIDHPSQLPPLRQLRHPPLIFLKIDAGTARAGVSPSSPACAALVAAAIAAERDGDVVFHGLYCHAGHSYGARRRWTDALGFLGDELRTLLQVARTTGRKGGLVLSVGATPSASGVQHPGLLSAGDGGEEEEEVGVVRALLDEIKAEGWIGEVHAGVYPTLDLQQLATHARDSSLLTANDIAISVLAEVASVYPSRNPAGTSEALITAGSLALGREPVADKGSPPGLDYAGWGFLMPWGPALAGKQPALPAGGFPRAHDGWQVGRISQEHGILTWHGRPEDEVPLAVGDRVRVWPNHSCIAGAGFDYYLVVDGGRVGREDEVVDVWVRWRGW
ncbi:putative serine dehydratase domain-containing protein [Schizothecium vesticola]|uniref:Serine dehydratase domain-containing protein n=1 Tax=Schizothecium vesticola TaxID=314040 RepID=A0AA40F9P8_9PEZI|nr:putative serine dehydratase domain-containing protein [Schizothecium vesticola]